MPFYENHQIGAKKFMKEELDKLPICFKGRLGQREKLKSVPDWQERLREYVDELSKNMDNQSDLGRFVHNLTYRSNPFQPEEGFLLKIFCSLRWMLSSQVGLKFSNEQ
ncbi:hypothetical protein [Oscillatoria acuminata]|uniref:Uncharacterized protein n=1 Tax=Oscillatoria acuminata PCC 6304 TaxID=56110 RepID=K9TN15_9CYAN|nr:hypothetical protein [Oscillatoria acuminata]AFY83940.1 hypothetical protein Oscil6304_4420 [Oscillatoria acuminata PCC 6304]